MNLEERAHKQAQERFDHIRKYDPKLWEMIWEREGLENFRSHLQSKKRGLHNSDLVEVWMFAGRVLSYLGLGHQGRLLLHDLHEMMLEQAQDKAATPLMTGTVLWSLAEEYADLGHPRTSERYFSLAVCADICCGTERSEVRKLGGYYGLRARHHHSEALLDKWLDALRKQFDELRGKKDWCAWIPEHLLTSTPTQIVMAAPSPAEARSYPVNRFYLRILLNKAEDGREKKRVQEIGEDLERLGNYIFQCLPGCSTSKKVMSTGTPDIIVRTIDPPSGFRTTLGEYLICECKNHKGGADVQGASQILDALMETECKVGVLLSLNGMTANAVNRIKIAYIRGVATILVLDSSDIEALIQERPLIDILQERYENLRFHAKKSR